MSICEREDLPNEAKSWPLLPSPSESVGSQRLAGKRDSAPRGPCGLAQSLSLAPRGKSPDAIDRIFEDLARREGDPGGESGRLSCSPSHQKKKPPLSRSKEGCRHPFARFLGLVFLFSFFSSCPSLNLHAEEEQGTPRRELLLPFFLRIILQR